MIGYIRILCAAFLSVSLGIAAHADERDDALAALFEALDIKGTIEVMRAEGLVYGGDLSETMLGEPASVSWMADVIRIYDPGSMKTLIEAEMTIALEGTDLSPLIAYFTSPAGAQFVTMELSARRAFMDKDTEAAALERYDNARADDAPILKQIDDIITDSDLIERNVAGALNSNLMFYRGMADGGDYDMSEEEMLRDVWAQEEDIRAETEGWLGSFLLMAYHPLDTGDLADYAALYRTPEGRDLNRALFVSFNRMYDELNYLLGRAVAGFEQSEKL